MHKLFTLLFSFILFNLLSANDLQDAYTSYQAGENATTLFERQKSFNKALQLYSKVEQIHGSHCDCDALEYNIGNSYFQLEQYPWAILHYYRALEDQPGNSNIIYNLTKAQEKQNIPTFTKHFSLKSLLLSQDYMPYSSRFRLFFIFGLTSLLLVSYGIWFDSYIQRILATITCAAALYLFLGLVYSNYFAPIEGVIVEATNLYKEPHSQALSLTAMPLAGGIKVDVLNVIDDGQWLKIISPDGKLGYISYEKIRLI